MAKKINTEEKPPVTTDDTPQGGPANTTETTETANGAEPTHAETAPPAKPEQPAEENHQGAQAPDAHVLELLKKFPGYSSLYIDAHGGTFSPDTPAAIRGKTVLYENPFYNRLKDKS